MTTTAKLAKRNDRFERIVADTTEAPVFSTKSHGHGYLGFNYAFQAEKLLKNNEINQTWTHVKKAHCSKTYLLSIQRVYNLRISSAKPSSTV